LPDQGKYKIVIVGAEQKYWASLQEERARKFIRGFMSFFPAALFISGDCPYGGVDQWVKETARVLNKSFKSIPPQKKGWYWYKKRNIQMAKEGDLIINLEPYGHTSGGTWTKDYALKIGKYGFVVEF